MNKFNAKKPPVAMNEQLKQKLDLSLNWLNASLNSLDDIQGKSATIQKYILLAKTNLEDIVSDNPKGKPTIDDSVQEESSVQHAIGRNSKLAAGRIATLTNPGLVEIRQGEDFITLEESGQTGIGTDTDETKRDRQPSQKRILKNARIRIELQPGSPSIVIKGQNGFEESKIGTDTNGPTKGGVQDLTAARRAGSSARGPNRPR